MFVFHSCCSDIPTAVDAIHWFSSSLFIFTMLEFLSLQSSWNTWRKTTTYRKKIGFCLYLVYGSFSKYTYFFLFIFWWHQIFSFTFFFSRLVLPTLQWYIHIICSRENHHDKNYFKICCTPSYLSVCGVTNIKLIFAWK